jgi:dienelactone hydrolase
MRAGLLHAALAALCLAAGAFAARADTAYGSQSVTVRSTTAGTPQDLPATLLKPEGAGPFPAVVILHDCSGLGARSSGAPLRWGRLLAARGYVVVIADSFAPRGFPDGVCVARGRDPRFALVSYAARAADAYAALAYLRTLPYVDGRHVGVMGGSHGGSSTLATMVEHDTGLGQGRGFAAGVALYPACAVHYGAWGAGRRIDDRHPIDNADGVYRPLAPLLILIGEKDDWTPAAHCQDLAARSRAAGLPVAIKVYAGAHHSFDSNAPVRYVPERRNFNKPDGFGATTGGNAAAWADSIAEVTAFFARHLNGGPQ